MCINLYTKIFGKRHVMTKNLIISVNDNEYVELALYNNNINRSTRVF